MDMYNPLSMKKYFVSNDTMSSVSKPNKWETCV